MMFAFAFDLRLQSFSFQREPLKAPAIFGMNYFVIDGDAASANESGTLSFDPSLRP